MQNKIIQYTFIAGFILIGFSVFYYYVIALPQKNKMMLEQQQAEFEYKKLQDSKKEAQQVKEQERIKLDEANKKTLLENCFKLAEQEHKRNIDYFVKIFNENCANPDGWTQECHDAFNDSFAKYEKEEKEDREECYKRYPQK